jgi:hypothetical protein
MTIFSQIIIPKLGFFIKLLIYIVFISCFFREKNWKMRDNPLRALKALPVGLTCWVDSAWVALG